MLEQAAGRPGDVHFGYALGSACHHAGRIERHAQVPGLGLQDPAGELAQSGRPGLGRVQDDLRCSRGHANYGHRHVRLIGRNLVPFLLFSLPITYPCSILA